MGSRAPSALSIHARDSPTPPVDSSQPGPSRSSGKRSRPYVLAILMIAGPPLSRTPSTRTITQSRGTLPPSPRQPISRSFRTSSGSQRRPPPPLQATNEDTDAEDESPPPADDDASESSESSSEDESQSVARSQAFRRPTRLQSKEVLSSDDAEDDDDGSSGGFLPFAAGVAVHKEDPAATIRSSPPKRAPHPEGTKPARLVQRPVESSASSVSSTAAPSPGHGGRREDTRPQRMQSAPADALSPKRRAELAKLSPRTKKEGSEGTPSMGSSFSDLDGTISSRNARITLLTLSRC